MLVRRGPEDAGGWPSLAKVRMGWVVWRGGTGIQPTTRKTEILLHILWDSDHCVQFIEEWSHRSRWLGKGQQNIQVLFLFVCKVFLVILVTVSPLPRAWPQIQLPPTHFPCLSPPAPPPISPTPASWWFWKPTWIKLLGLGVHDQDTQPWSRSEPRPRLTLYTFFIYRIKSSNNILPSPSSSILSNSAGQSRLREGSLSQWLHWE